MRSNLSFERDARPTSHPYPASGQFWATEAWPGMVGTGYEIYMRDLTVLDGQKECDRIHHWNAIY